jgi:hypothetical protein
LTNMGQTSDQDQSDCIHLVSSPYQYSPTTLLTDS